MRFVQIIEYRTARIEEVDRVLDEWLTKTEGRRTGTRGIQTRDRDNADTYLQIVEFPDYEAAMANSALPETTEVAEQLMKLCDAPPTFRNLDVLRDESM